MGHYDECRAAEDRRPSPADRAERSTLSGSAKLSEPPYLNRVAQRIEKAHSQVAELTQILDNYADSITGGVPEATGDENRAMGHDNPCGGTLGEVFSQLAILESRVQRLAYVSQRFSPLA